MFVILGAFILWIAANGRFAEYAALVVPSVSSAPSVLDNRQGGTNVTGPGAVGGTPGNQPSVTPADILPPTPAAPQSLPSNPAAPAIIQWLQRLGIFTFTQN